MKFMGKLYVFAAAAAAGLVSAAAAQEATLRMGITTSLQGPAGVAATKLVETVNELTKGGLKIELYAGAQLGAEAELIAGVRSGTIDLADVGVGAVSTIQPSVQVAALPFIWKSRDSFWEVVNGPIGQQLLDDLDSKGIKGLAWGFFGERAYLTKGFVVNSPDDLKGRKMRATQSPIFVETMKAMGGNPVPLPFTEIYTALQQNAVDGVDTSLWAMVEGNFQEVATNVADTRHMFDSSFYLANKQVFDGLKPEFQEALVAAARAAGQVKFDAINAQTDSSIATMEKAGVVIDRPDIEPFRARVQPVYDMMAPEIGQDLIDAVVKAQE